MQSKLMQTVAKGTISIIIKLKSLKLYRNLANFHENISSMWKFIIEILCL